MFEGFMSKIQWDTFKKLIASLVIFSMLYPDAARCMQENETEEFPITHSTKKKESPFLDPLEEKNKSTTGNSPENSDSFDDSLSPRKIEVTEVKTGNNSSGNSPTKELDKTSSEEKTDSGGVSPQKIEQIPNEETLKIIPLNQEITSLSLENKKGEQTQNSIIIVIGADESQKFNAKLGGNEGKSSPQLVDIQKGVQEHNRSILLIDPKPQDNTVSPKKNYSGITLVGNVIYLGDEKEDQKEEWEDWNEKDKQDIKEIDLSRSQPNKGLKNKKKVETGIFFIEGEQPISGDKNSSQQPTQKKQMVVEFLKESFSKLNETFKKIVPIELKEKSVPNSKNPLLINEDEEYTEESHLLSKEKFIDIEKEGSNQQKPLEECLKDILVEDEEKTALCFEECYKTASDKTLCQELEGFFEESVALGPLFAQDLENMLKENAGLKKITIQDWFTHMGLNNDHKTGKVQILSTEMIQFYELFNQILTYHIATTLFKDKIPEEDLEKFKSFLLHFKDRTIDDKPTWKQVVGALGGVAIAALAAYGFNLLLTWGLIEVFVYYQTDLWGSGAIARKVAPVLATFMTFDAMVRNARLFIDFFSPKTTRFTLPMDPKIAKTLWWKKAGAYGWSFLPALIPIYYYLYYTVGAKWIAAPVGLNAIWDNSARLINNEEKKAEKQFLQKVENEYPSELKGPQKALIKELDTSGVYLETAPQQEINKHCEEVYSSGPLVTENAKMAHVLHVWMYLLELGNFKTKEPLLFSSDSSSQISFDMEKQEESDIVFEKKEENPSSSQLIIKEVKKEKTKICSKAPTLLSYVIPGIATPVFFWGAKYAWENVILCATGDCWVAKTALTIGSGIILGAATWFTTSYVQKASIQNNVKDLSKFSKTQSQSYFRKGWEIVNYPVAGGLTINDFMLWAYATDGMRKAGAVWNGLRYVGMGFAALSEVSSTNDSLNGSSNDFVTGLNRFVSFFKTVPQEGFRRQRLIEMKDELSHFVKTLRPEVAKVFFKILPVLRKAWREGSKILPQDLVKLFGNPMIEDFQQYAQNLKEKKEKIESEMKEFVVIENKKEEN
jgi:hypothetical protein